MIIRLLEMVATTLVNLTVPSIRVVGSSGAPVPFSLQGSPRAVLVLPLHPSVGATRPGFSGMTCDIFDGTPLPALASPRVTRWVKSR